MSFEILNGHQSVNIKILRSQWLSHLRIIRVRILTTFSLLHRETMKTYVVVAYRNIQAIFSICISNIYIIINCF